MIILIDQPLTNDHQDQGLTGSRCPTRSDPKIENDWVPGNKISFGKQ